MKEEALKLADELEALHQYVPSEAPAMIRSLVEQYVDKNENHRHEPVIPEGYVILCKKCGEDLGYIFDEHPKVTNHEELTAVTKEWVYVQGA